MAVTQQLVRVTADYLAACRQSANASPDGDPQWDPPSSDCLDLDWAPAMLERACELARLDTIHLNALRHATEGDTALDLGFLNTHPNAIGAFGPAPTALSAAAVAHVSALIGEIDIEAILAALPADNEEAGSLIGHGAEGVVGGPREYLLGHFIALREFYGKAAGGGLLVVLWWD
ncbi:DUF1877 domain-containing protein [Streptomyces sp. NPDC057617]|uniref:DUF1877 domain-containing protein n=1 Tax=Streptomyces sp. NPDC057617 TaxID=3346184 RepID=UPI0036CB0BD5